MVSDVSGALKRLGVAVVTGKKVEEYKRDKSPYVGARAIAVARPRTVRQVCAIMRYCNRNGIRVVTRGGGTSLTGASIPGSRCVVLDMTGFNRILEIHEEDKYVVAEPGVMLSEINEKLERFNCMYPPDPASAHIASLGGTIATNAGGLKASLYGATRNWVMGLEVVLPNGKVVWTGSRTNKRSIGYDLTALMVGSEGTLGVVTKAILKIQPKPEATAMFSSFFPTIRTVTAAMSGLSKRGIVPSTAEFIDRQAMDRMSKYRGLRFPKDAQFMVFIEISSTNESIIRLLEESIAIFKKCGAKEVSVARSRDEKDKLFESRRHLLLASQEDAGRSGRSVMIADIVVPPSKLHTSIPAMQKAARASHLDVVMYGHIGDGNIHADIAYLPESKRETAAMKALQGRFGKIAISNMGSVSGEHGIGIEKKGLLREEFAARGSLENLVLMRKIKKQFDPNGILNPGKIFD